MGVNVEWVAAPGAWDRLILPDDFTNESSDFFDAYDEVPDEHYGIVIDSGGHYTLVVGSPEDLNTLSTIIAGLAQQAHDHRNEARLTREEGTCDTCGAAYPLASREGRCGDCGECSLHCPHLGAQVINRMKELAPEWEVGWEYPGIFTLRLDGTHEMATALNGWHYATLNVLVDGSWEPDPDASLDIVFTCTAPGHDADPESCTHTADAATLADAIETAALGWQEARNG